MDETASAIARLREEAKPEKSSRSERAANDASDAQMGRSGSGTGTGNRESAQVAPASTTRRQKTGGG